MKKEEAVAAKKAEILHYEGVLERYGSGRWLDMGRRHLADLKEELSKLEENCDNEIRSHSDNGSTRLW